MLDRWIETVTQAFDALHGWIFQTLVMPLVYALDLSAFLEDAHAGTAWLLLGLLQILVMLTVIRTLERWRPVEAIHDRPAIRDDIVYTLIHRLGLFKLVMFFTLGQWAAEGIGWLRVHGLPSFQLDHLWPGVTDRPWVSFLIYLVVLDALGYLIHRLQHRWDWWWQLHALHHSQRQLTMWSDNRNHLLDDVIRDLILVGVALLIGVEPAQFMGIVALTLLLESLSHANARLDFGPILGRLLVSPRFHRHHHAIGDGHESAGVGTLGGHNFSVLFPVWDQLFGTARFDPPARPTGIRDQLPGDDGRPGRDYGRGFWRQQALGLMRLLGRA